MKKTLFFIFGFYLLAACNQPGTATTDTQDSTVQTAASGLTLNNGNKWMADTNTNQRVVDLRTIADNFKIQPAPALNAYNILGNDLDQSLQRLLKECKMTGADHEALHHWLEPLLQETKQLITITDSTKAKQIFDSVDQRIDLYHQYFQ